MYVRHKRLFDAGGADGQAPGGAAPAAAPTAKVDTAAAPAAGAAGASSPGANGAPGAAASGAGSLMARGAATGAAGQPAAAAPGDAGQPAAIPEKYIVKNEDGTPNWEASALKQAQGYASLAQRLGAGEAPPKDADSYQLELPQGLSMDAVKTDPMFAGFLKGAHAKGLNNGQVSYLLGEFQQRLQLLEQQRSDPGVAEAELRKTWQTDQQMDQGLTNAARATSAFAGDRETYKRLEQKFGSDPDYLRLMANIGKELGEDKPLGGLTSVESDTLESLMSSKAYLDAKAPDHASVVAKVRALYAKRHPS